MDGELVYDGARFKIRALRLADGSEPALEFIEALDRKDQKKVEVLFVYMGDHGRITKKSKFKMIEGTKLMAFKSHQVRILAFYGRQGEIILADGLRKKDDKYKAKDLERATQYREWYFSQIGEG